MSSKKKKHIPTLEQVNELLTVKKITARELYWQQKTQITAPQWIEFKTACKIENEIREDVFFISTYRSKVFEYDGNFEIVKNEKFTASILIGRHRIAAIDCDDVPHTNKKGKGLPYYKQTIDSRSHKHIWCDQGEGYVEPIDDIENIEDLLNIFQKEFNLVIMGKIKHPMQGIQKVLI